MGVFGGMTGRPVPAGGLAAGLVVVPVVLPVLGALPLVPPPLAWASCRYALSSWLAVTEGQATAVAAMPAVSALERVTFIRNCRIGHSFRVVFHHNNDEGAENVPAISGCGVGT